MARTKKTPTEELNPAEYQSHLQRREDRRAKRRESAGFTAGETARPGMPTRQREQQSSVDTHNTYQRPEMESMPDYNAYANDPRAGVQDALRRRRENLVSANEVTLRQIGSDKAHGFESSRIAEDAARESYRGGMEDYKNYFDQSKNTLGNTRDEKIAALEQALAKAQAGYGASDARRGIEEQDQFNRMKAMYGNLGTMAGSQFTDAASRYGAFTQAHRDQIRDTRTADEMSNRSEQARADEYYGAEIGRLGERGGELATKLSQQQMQNLMQIQSSEDRMNREAAIRSQESNLNMMQGVAGADHDTMSTLAGWDERDRAWQREDEQMARDDSYRERLMEAQYGGKEKDPWDLALDLGKMTGRIVDPHTGEEMQTLDAKKQNQDYVNQRVKSRAEQIEKERKASEGAALSPYQTQQSSAAARDRNTAKVALMRFLSPQQQAFGSPEAIAAARAAGHPIPQPKQPTAQEIDAQIDKIVGGGSGADAAALRRYLAEQATRQTGIRGITGMVSRESTPAMIREWEAAIERGLIPSDTPYQKYVNQRTA